MPSKSSPLTASVRLHTTCHLILSPPSALLSLKVTDFSCCFLLLLLLLLLSEAFFSPQSLNDVTASALTEQSDNTKGMLQGDVEAEGGVEIISGWRATAGRGQFLDRQYTPSSPMMLFIRVQRSQSYCFRVSPRMRRRRLGRPAQTQNGTKFALCLRAV